MARQPQITIVMPVYNPPVHRLEASIASVRDQTDENWTLVVVDDGSTESSVIDALQSMQSEDNRIQLVRQSNCGPSTARNRGTAEATGDYVTYLDCDDELPPQTIEIVRSHLCSERPDLFLLYVQFIATEDEKVYRSSSAARLLTSDDIGVLKRQVMTGRMPRLNERGKRIVLKNGPVGRYVRTEIAQRVEFPENIRVSEDTIWNLRLLEQVSDVVEAKTVGYWYWTSHASSVRGYRPNAYAETADLLKLLRSAHHGGTQGAVSSSDYYARALGEVNRSIKLHYSRPECPLAFREKTKQITELLELIDSRSVQREHGLLRSPFRLIAKHVILRSGVASPCYALLRRADAVVADFRRTMRNGTGPYSRRKAVGDD